jgi:tRNA G18 (ribose-2'-O)-methylase SpoU
MINKKKTMPELDRLTAKDFKKTDKIPLTILLDDVRSMHNVGSVFRSADSFLAEKIYLCGYTPAPPHRDIHKTALGATETVSWQWEKDILTCLHALKKDGYKIYAIEQVHNSIKMNHFVPDKLQKTALIFGNEVNGVSQQAIDLCDGCIEIPQLGSKHSLNISVSAGIVLWHWAKEYL